MWGFFVWNRNDKADLYGRKIFSLEVNKKYKEKSLNIGNLLENGRVVLQKNNIEDAEIKANIILQYVLKMNKIELLINKELEVSKTNTEKYNLYIAEASQGKPVQYITNKQEFMKLSFYVDENVLIPQPDTEVLVEEVLAKVQEIAKKREGNHSKSESIKILDLCTGSGAISISLYKYGKNVEIYASDVSEKAIEIAKKNAIANNANVELIVSDMFNQIEICDFDIIVSNPPYIRTNVIKTLSKEVQNEPHIALDGGNDGLDFYKIIASEGYKHIKDKGYVLVEIGYDQKDEVIELFKKVGHYEEIQIMQDLAGNNRVIKAKVIR